MFCLFIGKYWSYQIFKERLYIKYKVFFIKNTLRQPPWKSSNQSLYPDQFYFLTEIQSSISMFIYNFLFCRRGQIAAIGLKFLNQKGQLIEPVTFPATRRQAQQKNN